MRVIAYTLCFKFLKMLRKILVPFFSYFFEKKCNTYKNIRFVKNRKRGKKKKMKKRKKKM